MVAGKGSYRLANRNKPNFEIFNLDTESFDRNKKKSIIKEYYSVFKNQINYIKKNISNDDLVIVTSAPFLSIFLIYFLPLKCKKIYWLFDYFPASLKCLYNIPNLIKKIFDMIWEHNLNKWDSVIKISENLGYFGKNVKTFRQWPMIEIKPSDNIPAKSVLYTGNLGIAHDADALIKICSDYMDKGYGINIYADGPKVTNCQIG